MCGICGVVYGEREREAPEQTLRAATDAIASRGPDAVAFHRAPGVGLGHRRLKVIDLETGDQPMLDADRRAVICYNGEVYNFLELREQLEALGVRFRTRSDTEVILLGYLQWGAAVFERLVGMFAVAIWDFRDETLLLARDRLGVKPLYWSELPEGGVAFGSELSAVERCRETPSQLNHDALATFLSLTYIPGEASAVRDIRRLPPATVLTWRRGARPEQRCFWDLAAIWREKQGSLRDADEIDASFAELMRLSVKQRLVSDVPLGAFLSGGLDSTTISALMMEARPPVDTFSIGFTEGSFDESAWARLAASSLGTQHHEEVVRCEDPALLVDVVSRLDEPFADTSIVPTYLLCQTARKNVTVALSGDGGDELLAGYVTNNADAFHRTLSRLPSWLLAPLNWGVNLLPDSRRKVNAVFKAKQFLSGATLDACDAHASWRMVARPPLVRELLNADIRLQNYDPFAPYRRAYADGDGLSALDRFLYVDYKTWLLDDILVKADRASMAHGLEVRSPFLDHRLVEFAAAIPADMKLKALRGKQLLRRFAQPMVPQATIKRKKAGFNAPVSDWLCGAWRELVEEYLLGPALRDAGVLQPKAVATLVSEHRAARRDHGFLLFNLLVLSLWLAKRGRSGGDA